MFWSYFNNNMFKLYIEKQELIVISKVKRKGGGDFSSYMSKSILIFYGFPDFDQSGRQVKKKSGGGGDGGVDAGCKFV